MLKATIYSTKTFILEKFFVFAKFSLKNKLQSRNS